MGKENQLEESKKSKLTQNKSKKAIKKEIIHKERAKEDQIQRNGEENVTDTKKMGNGSLNTKKTRKNSKIRRKREVINLTQRKRGM